MSATSIELDREVKVDDVTVMTEDVSQRDHTECHNLSLPSILAGFAKQTNS